VLVLLLLLCVQASFLEFAPAYFEHMAHAAATNTPTTLAKIAGVYSISLKQQSAQSSGQVRALHTASLPVR
jgi:hypothetical protein